MNITQLTFDPSQPKPIKTHMTVNCGSYVEYDLNDRFDERPVSLESMEFIVLDAGGFSRRAVPIIFETHGIRVHVNREQVVNVLCDIKTHRPRAMDGGRLTKVYFQHYCLVLPTRAWISIVKILEVLMITLPLFDDDGDWADKEKAQ